MMVNGLELWWPNAILNILSVSLWSTWWSLMYWILHLRTNFLLINSCSRLYSADHYIRDIMTNECVCRQSVSFMMWVTSSRVLDPEEILTLLTHCWMSKKIQKVCHLWGLSSTPSLNHYTLVLQKCNINPGKQKFSYSKLERERTTADSWASILIESRPS